MHMRVIEILIALCMLYPSLSFGAGYTASPSGFDMNRNGIIGEAADNKVCNGVTTDPDGDGVNEHMIYVDSNAGNDTTGNGSPGTPYKTLGKAFSSVTGPGNGAEDIICISGIFISEKLTLPTGGVPGFYTRDNFQFPKNPFMLVGWDKNGNGIYPPFDPADTAIIDGQNIAGYAINNDNKQSYYEIAHLTIKNYTQGGAITWTGSGSGSQSHMYMHDVEMYAINKGDPSHSDYIVASFWNGGNTLSYVAMINNLVDEYGSFFARGSPNGGGNYRFQNLTLKMHGQDGAAIAAVKLWETHNNVEILDNIIDANVSAWAPNNVAYAIDAAQCTQDWTIRGNTFINLNAGIIIQPFAAGFCTTRPVKNILIDRNIFKITSNYWTVNFPAWNQPSGIRILAGPTLANTVEDVTITNNFFAGVAGPWRECLASAAGNDQGPNPGTITIAGNTCEGPFTYQAVTLESPSTYKLNNYVFKDNIIANTGGSANVVTTYAPTNWLADGNVYDPNGNYSWANVTKATLADWKTASGQDANSKACSPAFVNVTIGDLHLLPSDTCAKSAGVDISGITTVDIDGQLRSVSSSASGADEVNVLSAPINLIVLP